MTTIKEQIRAEIERRIQRENEILRNAKKRGTYPSPSCEYNLQTLTSLRDFIDSLPEATNSQTIQAERIMAADGTLRITVHSDKVKIIINDE